ncbi:ethanolamine-phosphate cytidylyltransferase-like protein [Tanacetum coccineum]
MPIDKESPPAIVLKMIVLNAQELGITRIETAKLKIDLGLVLEVEWTGVPLEILVRVLTCNLLRAKWGCELLDVADYEERSDSDPVAPVNKKSAIPKLHGKLKYLKDPVVGAGSLCIDSIHLLVTKVGGICPGSKLGKKLVDEGVGNGEKHAIPGTRPLYEGVSINDCSHISVRYLWWNIDYSRKCEILYEEIGEFGWFSSRIQFQTQSVLRVYDYGFVVVSTKPSPAIITTVVSAWSFLLTTMDLAMRKRWSGDVLNGAGPNARVVYIDGGFDLFHAGHVEILKNARQLGDFLLIVSVPEKGARYPRGDNI